MKRIVLLGLCVLIATFESRAFENIFAYMSKDSIRQTIKTIAQMPAKDRLVVSIKEDEGNFLKSYRKMLPQSTGFFVVMDNYKMKEDALKKENNRIIETIVQVPQGYKDSLIVLLNGIIKEKLTTSGLTFTPHEEVDSIQMLLQRTVGYNELDTDKDVQARRPLYINAIYDSLPCDALLWMSYEILYPGDVDKRSAVIVARLTTKSKRLLWLERQEIDVLNVKFDFKEVFNEMNVRKASKKLFKKLFKILT